MAKHYGLKAEMVEIKTDPTLMGQLKMLAKKAWSSLRFQVRRLLRCRTR